MAALPCHRYTNIWVGRPCVEDEYTTEDITPQQCRLRDITYAAPIYVDIEYTRGREIVTRKGPNAVKIGRMPLMLRCNRCILHNKDEDQLARLGG
jgi:DNA-directed RNA polymerase III subunit RPC2